MQTKLDESEKKLELVATTLQTFIRETPTKVANTWKGHYQNMDKDNGSTSKEVHGLDRYTKYICIRARYTQTLEHLLSKGMINLPGIRPETENT